MQLRGFMIVVADLNVFYGVCYSSACFCWPRLIFLFFRNIFSTPAILAFMQTVFPLTRALSFNYWNTSNHKERASRNFCKLEQCSLRGGEGGLNWGQAGLITQKMRREAFFFFLILEPKNNVGIVVYLHLPFPTKRAVWDGNVCQVYFSTCLFHAWPPISSANWIDYLQYISRFICSFHHLHITLIHSCKTVVFLREILQNNWLTQL